MSDELLDKPGTTPEKTGEPEPVAAEDSESLEGADREAEAAGTDEDQPDRTDWKGMALGFKGRLEERNRLDDESRLRAAQTSPTTDSQMANVQDEMKRIQQAVLAVQIGADANDPGAIAMMALLKEQYQSAQRAYADRVEMKNELELFRIRDDEEREQVRTYWNAHQNECATISVARKAMLGERYESERKSLAHKTKQADEIVANRRAGVVKVYSREVAATEAKSRRMMESDYDAEISRLRNEGDSAGVRSLMSQLQSESLKITPG